MTVLSTVIRETKAVHHPCGRETIVKENFMVQTDYALIPPKLRCPNCGKPPRDLSEWLLETRIYIDDYTGE